MNAAYYAVAMARHIQANVMLLHVLPLPLTISEVPIPVDSYDIALDEANSSLKNSKAKLEQYTAGSLSISTKCSTSSFLDEIANINMQNDVFAMIMGTSGAGATQAFFLGSFSISAAKHLHHPVIVVPPDYKYQAIEKIGLACDMKEVSESLPKNSIHALLNEYKASLEVLYVSSHKGKHYPEVLAESKFLQIWLDRKSVV